MLMLLMAQSYVDSLSDNVKRSLDHKLRKGEWIGPALLGYLNNRDEKGNSIIVLDPVRASIIKKSLKNMQLEAILLVI